MDARAGLASGSLVSRGLFSYDQPVDGQLADGEFFDSGPANRQRPDGNGAYRDRADGSSPDRQSNERESESAQTS
jgi:hypothetical protein